MNSKVEYFIDSIKNYPEKQIPDLIGYFHPDVCEVMIPFYRALRLQDLEWIKGIIDETSIDTGFVLLEILKATNSVAYPPNVYYDFSYSNYEMPKDQKILTWDERTLRYLKIIHWLVDNDADFTNKSSIKELKSILGDGIEISKQGILAEISLRIIEDI
jgi:hypothetical protein